VPAPVFLGPLHPRHGTHEPSSGTPGRVPGSVRRTVTTDILRPDGINGRLVLVGRGRDLRTDPSGGAEMLSTASTRVEVDFTGNWGVRSLASDPERPALQQTLGRSAGSGFRAAVLAANPELPAEHGLLHQLLDDVPVTTLVSGHAWGAETARHRERSTPVGRSMFGRDMCAGFADGGTIMTDIDATGRPPIVIGPVAGDLTTADPSAWHDLPPLPPHAMRRARRTDVGPGPDPAVDILFRDTYVRPDGLETVIHEYLVTAQLAGGRIAAIRATPRALPWVECPAAAASADRLVGVPVEGLRALVRRTFTGTSTCTHLNDTLRSLEDVARLTALTGG
jgi:Protein of unknown function (DUF2889)